MWRSLLSITTQAQQLFKRMAWLRQCTKGLILLVLFCLMVRSLPYLAPIHAKDLTQDRQAVEFSDRHGLPLGTLLTRDQEHTAVVELPQVSSHFIHAILAAEDGRFHQHHGLDMVAVGRSLWQVMQTQKITSGASTITMQLASMLQPAPRNWRSKVSEIWLAWRLEAGMSKAQILQAYINRLPMGGNIYGVEAASRIYFGISANNLNLAQASLLASIPNDPTNFYPYGQIANTSQIPASLKQRQLYVLHRMVKSGHITQMQSDRADAEIISLRPRQQGIIAAPHFLFWLANQLPQQHSSQIRTTIDRSLQQFVEAQTQQIVEQLAAHNVHQAAALVISNHTGEVLAYVGSPDYFGGGLGRNDGVQALRQAGSTLKPFLYELAIAQRAIRPNTVLADVPTHYAIPNAQLYSPVDYSETFQGPVRVRIALANSLNIPAVRVLEKVGVPTFLNRLKELGFEHLKHPPEYYGLGLTLGSGEVTLWELARAYLALAKQGEFTQLLAVSGQQEEDSQRSAEKAESRKLIADRSSQLITDILSDRYARAKAFGVDSVLNLPFAAAVKTGTSSNFRDTWTVGFTTDYTVATWVGNFSGEPMQKVSGVMGAAPLWQRIMLHLHETQEPANFPAPNGLVKRSICALSGMRPTPACPTVVQEYFYPQDLRDYELYPDTFYQLVTDARDGKPQYRLNLPQEYDEWLAMQSGSTLALGQLRIISPRHDDYFLLESTRGDNPPKLEFKLAQTVDQSAKPVEWWLNGKKLATQTSSSLFWKMQQGEWTLEVRNGDLKDRVSFQVQPADQHSQRSGFSLVK